MNRPGNICSQLRIYKNGILHSYIVNRRIIVWSIRMYVPCIWNAENKNKNHHKLKWVSQWMIESCFILAVCHDYFHWQICWLNQTTHIVLASIFFSKSIGTSVMWLVAHQLPLLSWDLFLGTHFRLRQPGVSRSTVFFFSNFSHRNLAEEILIDIHNLKFGLYCSRCLPIMRLLLQIKRSNHEPYNVYMSCQFVVSCL